MYKWPGTSSAFSLQWAVCSREEMPWEKHRSTVCRQIHQEKEDQIQPAGREPWGYREGGQHPEGDPAPQRHHPARGLWEQDGRHPDPGTVSAVAGRGGGWAAGYLAAGQRSDQPRSRVRDWLGFAKFRNCSGWCALRLAAVIWSNSAAASIDVVPLHLPVGPQSWGSSSFVMRLSVFWVSC